MNMYDIITKKKHDAARANKRIYGAVEAEGRHER